MVRVGSSGLAGAPGSGAIVRLDVWQRAESGGQRVVRRAGDGKVLRFAEGLEARVIQIGGGLAGRDDRMLAVVSRAKQGRHSSAVTNRNMVIALRVFWRRAAKREPFQRTTAHPSGVIDRAVVDRCRRRWHANAEPRWSQCGGFVNSKDCELRAPSTRPEHWRLPISRRSLLEYDRRCERPAGWDGTIFVRQRDNWCEAIFLYRRTVCGQDLQKARPPASGQLRRV